MPIRIGKITMESAPIGLLGRLDDRCAGRLGFGQDLFHLLFAGHVVRQRYPRKTAAFGADPRVFRQGLPSKYG